jgi:general secretion pathway protein I
MERFVQYRPWIRARADGIHGFTLVEVLVALAVIAIALTAVMQNFGQGVDTTIALRDRTVALWVAQNQLATHYIRHTWPTADTTEGVTEMAGREWRWREQVMTTAHPDVRRIEIQIRAAPDREALARLVGFLPKPTNVTGTAPGSTGTGTQ